MLISISALILTRLKIITLYWALNFVKQEATYIWRKLTVFPFEPSKSLNNLVLLAGYFQVWSNLNTKSAARVLKSKTSKRILSFNWMPIFWYHSEINFLPQGSLAEAERITYQEPLSLKAVISTSRRKKSCLLFFAHEKGLGHMFQK